MDQKHADASKYQMDLAWLHCFPGYTEKVMGQTRVYATKKGVYGEVACWV